MLGFIYNNSGLFYFFGVILFLIVLYFIVKSLPIKVAKKEPAKKTEPVETKKDEIIMPEEKTEEFEEKTQNDKKDTEKIDKKPKIVQIYKRSSQEKIADESQKSDPIYDRNVEFVNVSKNVSKFKTFVTEEGKDEENNESEDEYGFVTDKQDDCEFCESNVKHFDHSKRMLSAIKNDDVNNLFSSHISDNYLNINSDRHLKLDEQFHNRLYEMTNIMMANSEEKVKSENDVIVIDDENFDEEDLLQDEVKFDIKTALVADTFMNRKKKK